MAQIIGVRSLMVSYLDALPCSCLLEIGHVYYLQTSGYRIEAQNMLKRNMSRPATLFLSYAHEDEALHKQLENHLSLLRHQDLLSPWHNRDVLPGACWSDEIDDHLKNADVILLLISANFLASDYCYEIEMQCALERHRRNEAVVIPVILKPCDWFKAPFGTLQALPRNAKAVTTWSNPDEAFTEIAHQLRHLLERHHLSGPVPASAHLKQKHMRQHLKQRYRDALADSLGQATWFDLNLADKPDALYNPVALIVRNAHLPERAVPAGTSIIQIYEEADQELLILGEPGSGKSTQLYLLAQHLLTLTETDQTAPFPIIFTLSSWASSLLSLETWMLEQLVQIYRVEEPLARQWLKEQQIIPLLDGLDEMEESVLPLCIAAINAYHQTHPYPLVVCSGSAEYQTASHTEQLVLQRAVVIKPLTATQVETALTKGGKAMDGVRAAVKCNPAFQELATTPLFLNLFMLTYDDGDIADLPTRTSALQQQVLEQYVKHMIERKGIRVRRGATKYSAEQMRRWLTFLAQQTRSRHQVSFAVEHLQPNWLTRGWYLCYYWSLPLLGGLFLGLLQGLYNWSQRGVVTGVVTGIATWLFFGLLFGIPFAGRRNTITLIAHVQWSWKKFRSVLWILPGLALLGPPFLCSQQVSFTEGVHVLLFSALCVVIFTGLSAEPAMQRSLLFPGEDLRRAFHIGLLGGLLGGLIGLLFGGIEGGLQGIPLGDPSLGLFFSLFLGLFLGGCFGLFLGLHAFTRQPHFSYLYISRKKSTN